MGRPNGVVDHQIIAGPRHSALPADARKDSRMEGKVVVGGEHQKQGKKRPASLTDGEEVKSAKAKNIDDEVDEFFSLLRNMREASRLLAKDNPRNPSFRAEDFADVCHSGGGDDSSSAACDGGGRRGEKEPSRNNHYRGEDEKTAKWEGSEDNGLPARLDLNVGPCSGSRQHQLPKRRGGRSDMEEGEDE